MAPPPPSPLPSPPSTTSPPPPPRQPTSPPPTATRKSSLQNRNNRFHQSSPQKQADAKGPVASIAIPKQRTQSPAGSVTSSMSGLPHNYRSNPSISNLFASTSGLGYANRGSGSSTPARDSTLSGSTLLSPVSAAATGDSRVVSPMSSTVVLNSMAGKYGPGSANGQVRDLIQCGFVPYIGVVASEDVDALLHARGFGRRRDGRSTPDGAFLELIKPFGEKVSGRVTIRDSSMGSSRTYDDYGVRFFGMARTAEAKSGVSNGIGDKKNTAGELGRVVAQIEEVVDRHLNFAELRPSASSHDFGGHPDDSRSDILSEPSTVIQNQQYPPAPTISPFYSLFLRRMLSNHPISPHETFAHPVACVIAISSRNASPIEEFKKLYESTNVGLGQGNRLPQWVNNDFLRYYVLVHDDDNGDIQKSTQLYEQMKRHFGLHCHLLRLRSVQCVPSDDDSVRLPACDWMSAAEELGNISNRELAEDYEDPTPCLFESDLTSLQAFVRELVTQSVVPSMERLVAQWNEQVANKRRGISGRIMSISKRWTPFGGGNTGPGNARPGSSNSYDPIQGSYPPASSEALMRKLADYAFMLRDYKLASSTYELLRSDNEHDKAWKHYAGANEMSLVATLMHTGSRATFQSTERWLDVAVHSYIHRCATPFYALRTLLLAAECLQFRGSLGVDEPARWASRVLETPGLIGQVGAALVMERVAGVYAGRRPVEKHYGIGARRRKSGFWWLMAADGWVGVAKSVQAERCLDDAGGAFSVASAPLSGSGEETTAAATAAARDARLPVPPAWMGRTVQELRERIVALKLEAMGDLSQSYIDEHGDSDVEPRLVVEDVLSEEEVSEELLPPRLHRKSIIGESGARSRPEGGSLEAAPLSPVRTRDEEKVDSEGFE